MKFDKRKVNYEAPCVEVFSIRFEEGLLTLTGNKVRLTGAGVDESDADNNGSSIW